MSEVTSTLSASEQAHFDSGGETPIEQTAPVAENTEVKAEAAQTEQVQEAVTEEKVQKVVPLAALHEERAKAKELKEQLRRGEERLNQLTQLVQQRLNPPAPPPEIPSVEVDPVAHFRAKNEALERQVQELAQPLQHMRSQAAQEQQIAQLQRYVSTQEAEFLKESPDYNDALTHMKQTSFLGLKALGYPDEQAAMLVGQEYVKMAHNVAINGGNVAEHVYNLARANGYTPKQAQQAADAQTKIQTAQKGVAAARSLGSGGNVVNGLSLKALAEMPADEFAKATADESAWRKMMGA